ncbi:hypothetical protein H0H92_001561, partial [Tricholoma furcatifolium]
MMQKCCGDVISKQILNWESMMRTAALRLKGEVDTAPLQLAEAKKTGEVQRDYSRRAFGESLRGDIG